MAGDDDGSGVAGDRCVVVTVDNDRGQVINYSFFKGRVVPTASSSSF